MKKFFEAFVYFVDNGIDPKTAKEFAEKVTGIKVKDAETLKAFTKEDLFVTVPKKDIKKVEIKTLIFFILILSILLHRQLLFPFLSIQVFLQFFLLN